MKDFLRLYLQPPNLHDLWTHNGIWILDRVATSMLYRLVFIHFVDNTSAILLAGGTPFLMMTFLLGQIGFSKLHALIINTCAMIIAVLNWPTLTEDIPTILTITSTVICLAISLPLFCHGMGRARLTAK